MIGYLLAGVLTASALPLLEVHQAQSAPTAGQIALLASLMDGPAVEAVAAAIEADDPMTRAVAARIAAVSAHPSFAPAIERAWGKERHIAAAAEQVRALLIIRGAAAAATIEARLGELPAASVDVYAAWVAAQQPEQLAALITKLNARANAPGLDLSIHVWSALNALDSQPEASERLLRGWMTVATPVGWRATLERLAAGGGSASRDAVVIDALKTPIASTREATVWYLVVRVAKGQPVTSAVLAAAMPQTGVEAAPTWESFGRELLARRHSGTRTADRTALLAAESSANMSDARAIALLPQLTDSERRALKSTLGRSFPNAEAEKRTPSPDSNQSASGTMRTIPLLWPGFLESLLNAAKCAAERTTTFGIASVTYRPDGRVAKLQIDSTPLPGGCSQVLATLARITLADPRRPPAAGVSELLVLPIGTDLVDCSNRMPAEPAEPVKIGGAIQTPRKTKNVVPDYPSQLQQRGVTGAVILEGVISPTGCMTSVSIRQGVVPALDFAALKAVSGWQFAPTVIDGVARSVTMTVTLNFSLAR